MALTNIALDHIGQARSLYQHVAQLEGDKESEDWYAFRRDVWDFRNCLIVEQPNGDFAQTILRSFIYDVFNLLHFEKLMQSADNQLAAIAKKAHKEVRYHQKYSRDWVIRLGDGTDESHDRAQFALDRLWSYHGELYEMSASGREMLVKGVSTDTAQFYDSALAIMLSAFEEATLKIPENTYMHSGGKQGQHSEHLGHILSEMQFLQRAYPDLEW